MTTIIATAWLAFAGTLLGGDLFEENRGLKKELAEQQSQLQTLHQKNQSLKIDIESLKVTNDLITGRIGSPPKDAPVSQIAVWDYKLDSSRDYLGGSWPRCAKTVKDGEAAVLKIVRTPDDRGKTVVEKWFSKEELEKIRGKRITCMVTCKGERIEGENSAAFTLMIPVHQRKTEWSGASIGKGSFDWRQLKLGYSVPLDAKGVLLVFGMQGHTGTIYFKDLRVTVSE